MATFKHNYEILVTLDKTKTGEDPLIEVQMLRSTMRRSRRTSPSSQREKVAPGGLGRSSESGEISAQLKELAGDAT